jgi:hypothetical protein
LGLFLATQKVCRSTKASLNHIKPIINKQELDSVDPADPRHFQNIKTLDGYESNAMSYNPRIQYVLFINLEVFIDILYFFI